MVSCYCQPSINETQKAIRQLKNNKSPGTDRIAAELTKNAAQVRKRDSSNCYRGDGNLGIIHPIYKKGDKLDCNNYRDVRVFNTAFKILSLNLQNRLVPHVEEIVGKTIKEDSETENQPLSRSSPCSRSWRRRHIHWWT